MNKKSFISPQVEGCVNGNYNSSGGLTTGNNKLKSINKNIIKDLTPSFNNKRDNRTVL